MTSITVEYFAQLREQSGQSREVVDSRAASLRELYDELRRRHGFRLDSAHVRVAVNARFSGWDEPLKEGDHVVFVPPVAGG